MSVACNLCGRDDAEPWGRPKDGLRLVRCRDCGLIYVNPRPTPEALTAYYGQEYFDGGDYAQDALREAMYRMEIAHMLPWIGSRGRFLDVGCAMGKFLSVLPGTFDKSGVEFSADAARHAREAFGLDVRVGQLSDTGVESSFYDVVQMRGVVEHLQDPRREVRAVRAALRPAGWFVLNQTPNLGGASALFYKERHNQVKPREHLYYFTHETLGRLLAEEGFSVRHVWHPYWGTPYATPWRDFPAFLLNLLSGRECPPFPGNMMAVYAQKAA